MRTKDKLPPVPTGMLLAYLIAIYASFGELVVLLIHLFTPQRLGLVAHATLIAVVVVFSLIAWRRKDDVRSLYWTGGRITLTRTQVAIVTVFVMSLCGLMAVLFELLFER